MNGEISSSVGPTVRVSVCYGPKEYLLTVPLQFTFGDLKNELAKQPGLNLNPEDQRLLFRGKEKKNNEILQSSGIKDMAKIMLLESPGSKLRKIEQERRQKERKLEEEKRAKERKLEEERENQERERKNQDILRSCEKISLVGAEVDKLANKVSKLEISVNEHKKLEEKEFTILPELLMIQLLKLDGIEAEKEAKVQRKNEVKRIQDLVEKVDLLKVKYYDPFKDNKNKMKSVEVTTQWETFDNGSGSNPTQQNEPVIETTEKWERFD